MKDTQHRHKHQIIYDVLKAVQKQPQWVTRVMYAANLSGKFTKRTLQQLEHVGLIMITVIGAHKLIRITDKGKEFIQAYERMMQLL